LHIIEHDVLKEMYTGLVDEVLDIQLEFEEKLAESEENAKE
jgi:chromosome segregation ATPase